MLGLEASATVWWKVMTLGVERDSVNGEHARFVQVPVLEEVSEVIVRAARPGCSLMH